jgi:hypothetical protein
MSLGRRVDGWEKIIEAKARDRKKTTHVVLRVCAGIARETRVVELSKLLNRGS